MFVTLEFKPYKKAGFIKSVFQKKKETITFEKRTLGNIYYYCIICERKSENIPWNEIEKIAGREAKRLVLPEGILPPKDSRVQKFVSNKFHQRLLLNSLKKVLSLAFIPPSQLNIALIDPNAENPEAVLELLPFSQDIKVITNRPNCFERVGDIALEEYGAVIVLTSNPQYLRTAGVIYAPFGISDVKETNGLVFALKQYDSRYITIGSAQIPEEIRTKIPENFDAEYFYSAIFERTRMINEEELLPVNLMIQGEGISFQKTAELIKKLDIADYI